MSLYLKLHTLMDLLFCGSSISTQCRVWVKLVDDQYKHTIIQSLTSRTCSQYRTSPTALRTRAIWKMQTARILQPRLILWACCKRQTHKIRPFSPCQDKPRRAMSFSFGCVITPRNGRTNIYLLWIKPKLRLTSSFVVLLCVHIHVSLSLMHSLGSVSTAS